jgi:hypothetical protein
VEITDSHAPAAANAFVRVVLQREIAGRVVAGRFRIESIAECFFAELIFVSIILQVAFAVLVTDRASGFMFVEEQFENGLSDFPDFICVRFHYQSVLNLENARGLQAPLSFDLDKTQSTRA